MKRIHHLVKSVLLLAALGAAAMSTSLQAEDIDIYFENSADGVLPKVLFVLDNSANVASTWGPAGCSSYADGSGAPSLGTNTAGGIIQCALVDTISSLPNGRLELGIMSGNANNFGTSRGCVGSSGGCLLLPLTEINASTRPAIISFIKGWKKENSGETATSFPFTVTSAEAGGMMQESYAYFYAKTGLSGRTYDKNHIEACQKNFIIYIGNTDKTPANEDPSGAALTTAGAANIPYGTGTLRDKITTTQKFVPPICPQKIETIAAGTNANDWSSNWADEWARFLQYKDGGTATQEGKQNITTYTIGIIDNASNQCTAPYAALLQSMASVSGGEAYRVGDAGAVKDAVARALNEVQAVNSVFSSASLPVSVNAEGSYLNQIFLGMFRPDSSGSPRWLGNLKQYQLARNSAGNLVMADACTGDGCPRAAINSKTGFLSPNAISFWTYKDLTTLPDANNGTPLGFFVNDPKGAETSAAFDSADGEVVEKGGVAQQLRKQNLTATFAGAGGTTVNPRRMYTYCAWGSTDCQNDLRHVDNDFATSNAKIPATAFGSALTVPVNSIVRNGSTATITTSGNHGFKTGSIVTIRNADQPEYNQTASIALVSGSTTKFTMTVPDYPTPTSLGEYTISVPGAGGSFAISSLSRTTTAGGSAEETVTVTTSGAHPYVAGQGVTLGGVSATEYNRGWQITAVPATNQFTFKVPIYPVSPSVNSYSIVHAPNNLAVSSITVSGASARVATSAAHGFHVNQTVTISNIKGGDRDLYNKDHVVTSVAADGMSFTIATPTGARTAGTGNVSPSSTAQVATITRNTTAVTGATATVSGLPANWFANGDKVNISTTGTSPNEAAYVKNDVIISCSGSCTSFTYPITVTPAVSGTGGSVTVPDAGTSADIAAGAIVRSGTTATVTLPATKTFTNGATVTISPKGTALANEAAYVGPWTVTCVGTSPCSKFTIGPIVLSPALVATGTNIQAYSGNTSPDRDVLIRWLRGEDNHGDEKGPGNGVTVRPSMHGDVLHSRPLVINYGDNRGVVVFYGSNDGVYRAVNGNQTEVTTNSGVTVPAGSEFWGLILPDHYEVVNRYRTNSPEVKFPGTFLSTALPKQYFIDGPTGVYQKIDADGVIQKAIIYLTMRRGGRFMYALDVTQPGAPKVLWQIRFEQTGFSELGQTWSRPRMTLLQNHKKLDPVTNTMVPAPVLVFGAGYDEAQDREPPLANTMGRGIFVVDAITGDKVFSASVSCGDGVDNCRKVANMKYATPSDIAFVDRDLDGFTDKFYWGDTGGNLWRADVADASVANWKITQVAALGCNTGECSVLTTPRKFFFPPAVLSVRPAGTADSYDALSIASGDREHPLRSEDPNSGYFTNDRFFMIKDKGTQVNSTALNTTGVVPNSLFNATYSNWDQSDPGFFVNFIGAAWTNDKPDSTKSPTLGEKAVNAPVAVNGQIFFSTNQPRAPDGTCTANLGTARAYAVNPFTGAKVQNELQGGGLPPSAVSGLISITETDGDGNTTTTQEKFCIGCGLSGTQVGGTNDTPCTSALENCNIGTVIPKNLKRTYWYKK